MKPADVLPLRVVDHPAVALAADLPLVVDAKRLATLLGCALRTIWTWNAAGKVPEPLRIGGRVVWRMDEIRAWLEAGAPDRETWAAIRART